MAPTLYHVPKTISSPIYQALIELGAVDSGEARVVALSFGDLKSEEHLARNPMGTSPTLVDEDRNIKIWESGAVLTYLLEELDKDFELHPRPSGVADPADRAKFLHVQQFITATAYPFVASWFLHTLKPKDERDPAYVAKAEHTWKTLLGPTLESFFSDDGGPYFMGTQMTAIDLLAAKPLNNAYSLGVLEEFPKLDALFRLVKCRPSFATAYGQNVREVSDSDRRRSIVLVPHK